MTGSGYPVHLKFTIPANKGSESIAALNSTCSRVDFDSTNSCAHITKFYDDANMSARLFGMATRFIRPAEIIDAMSEWSVTKYAGFGKVIVRVFQVYQRAQMGSSRRLSSVVLQDAKDRCLPLPLKLRTRCMHCRGVSENRGFCTHKLAVIQMKSVRAEPKSRAVDFNTDIYS